MKVLFINPPRENELVGNNPAIIDEERGYNPPLGLLYLGGYLKKYSDHEVEVIDAQVEELSYPRLKERIREARPDVVGIGAMTFTILDVLQTAGLVKEISPDIPVVIGGVHAFEYPMETIKLPGIDFVLGGEGEKITLDLIQQLSGPRRFETVAGLTYLEGGEVKQNPPPPLLQDLDTLPFPDRTLTPYRHYNSVVAKRSPITTMFTSRGCPFHCAFCSRPHLGKSFRYRSAANVVDEMEECLKLGIHEILVYDDTFTVNLARAGAVCNEIIKRDLDIGWDIRARVDCMDEKLLRKLKEAHCERIHYGVEAGTERILKVLNKGITLDQVRKTIAQTQAAGIQTLAYFMIGAPTETREEVMRTIDFALEIDPDFVHITILTPFPSTAIYDRGRQEGLFSHDHWQEFAADPRPDFQPPYWNAVFSDKELQELLQLAYKKFYTRPKYILKELKQISSWRELITKGKAGLKILTMKNR